MATFFANAPFHYGNLNLSAQAATGYVFGNNVFERIDGIVYEDVASVEFDFGASYLTFGGHGITRTGSTITGGTVTGIFDEYLTGSHYMTVWGIQRMSVDAEELWDVAHTASTADDRALIRSVLSGADRVYLSEASDVMRGYAGNDRLFGYSGADILYGDTGDDVLTGGLGSDRLFGGAGADVFDLNRVQESGLTASSRDVIGDFVRGSDKLDLRTIDADVFVGGNQAFTSFIGAAGSFNAPGQLRFVEGVLYGNTDTDAAAEFSVRLTGVSELSAADLLL